MVDAAASQAGHDVLDGQSKDDATGGEQGAVAQSQGEQIERGRAFRVRFHELPWGVL